MFLKFLFVTILLRFTYSDRCLQCICQQESGCTPIGCRWDVGSLSCGYYQIKLPYYKDCGEPGKRPGESTEDAWKRCSDDFSCATSCVENYFHRYRFKCPGKSDCEAMARLHNGGPSGCYGSSTDGYWNRIKQCIGSK